MTYYDLDALVTMDTIHDERILDAPAGCEIAGSFGANDTAVVEETADSGAEDAKRALACAGSVGGEAEGTGGRRKTSVYFIKDIELNRIKVGIATDVAARLQHHRTSSSNELELIASCVCANRGIAMDIERSVVSAAMESGTHIRGEWVMGTEAVMAEIASVMAGTHSCQLNEKQPIEPSADGWTLTCFRCGHSWYPRTPNKPKQCPSQKCHSPYWNRSRYV